ncbi:hypothetical protein BH20ACT6_BH20ACT6_22550 [soil metagenome]
MSTGGTALADGWRLAAGTLTAVPVRPPDRVDPQVAATAMLLAPVVGLLVAVPSALAGWALLALGLGSTAAALGIVAAGALLTRGMHLDGLADTADGLAAGLDRDRALQVMRRGDVGPVGVVTLVLVLIGQVVVGGQVVDELGVWALAAAMVAARTVLPVLCIAGWGAARLGGLGATVLGVVPVHPAALVGTLTALGVTGAVAATAVPGGTAAGPGLAGVYAVPAALLAGLAVAWQARRRLGGLTGDVLGAAVEVALLAALAALAAAA